MEEREEEDGWGKWHPMRQKVKDDPMIEGK